MAEQTDVRLIIQARDEASKQLQELVNVTQALVDENKKLTGSGKQADAALQSLRDNYKQLAEAADKLKQTKALADNFEKQAAAAKQAKAAVQANEQALADVTKRQKQASNSADQHAAALEKARTKVRSQTSLISRYRKQLGELTESEKDETKAIAELNAKLDQAQQKQAEARNERKRLTQAKQEATAEERKLTTETNRLNKALEKQRVTVKNAENAQKQAGQAAREAGIDTNKLSSEQNRLQKELEQTETSLNEARQRTREYSQAMRTAGNETRRTAKDTDRFGNASRKSMSLAQRARGQVLSLAAAYIGLYGAIDQVSRSFQTYFEAQSAAARLATQFGEDQQGLQQELDYVSYLADRLGRDMEALEKSYSIFFVTSRELGNTTEQTRGLFTMLAEASTAMKLTADDFNGAMRAITQIMSKGQIMAEELRGQLGERLPGAVSLMARAFGVSEQKLNKMMEQGELTAEALFGFAQTVRQEFGQGLPQAVNTFQAAWNRLQNAITRNRRIFAGAAEGQLRESIERLTQFLNSPQAAAGVEALANGFASVINAVVTLTQYTEELKALFEVLFLTWGASAVYRMGTSMVDLANNMRRATSRAEKLGKALRMALIIPGLIAGGMTLWEKYGDGLKQVFEEDLPGIMERAGEGILLNLQITFRKIVVMFKQLISKISNNAAKIADALGMDETAESLRSVMSGSIANDQATIADMEARLAKMRADQEAQLLSALQKIKDAAKAEAGGGDSSNAEELYEKGIQAAKKRARQAEREAEAKRKLAEAAQQQAKAERDAAKLKKDLYAIETKLLKERANSIADQKALVDRELMDITDRLLKAGDVAGLEIVEQYRQMKYEAIETADAKEKERAAEQQLNDLMQQRRDIVEYIKLLQDSERPEDQAMLQTMRNALTDINGELTKAIDKMIALAEAADNPALVARLKTMKENLKDTNREIIVSGEQINQQIAQRGSEAFMQIGEAMGEFILQGGSLSDVFKSAGDAFRQFAADTLKWLAQLIMRFIILKAVQGAMGGGGGFGGFVSNMLGAGTNHTGGLAGAGGNTRQLDAGWFANAARYHSGGIAGLRPNEVPTILERGEEVITRNDSRHRFNGGGAGKPQSRERLQIINAIDSDEVVQKGLSSGKGTRTVLNMIQSNRSEIKQILGN